MAELCIHGLPGSGTTAAVKHYRALEHDAIHGDERHSAICSREADAVVVYKDVEAWMPSYVRWWAGEEALPIESQNLVDHLRSVWGSWLETFDRRNDGIHWRPHTRLLESIDRLETIPIDEHARDGGPFDPDYYREERFLGEYQGVDL